MKKLFFAIVVVFLVGLGITYLYIPSTTKLSKEVILSGQRDAVFRNFINTSQWKKWWPGEVTDSSAQFEGRTYRMFGNSIDIAGINIEGNDVTSRSVLRFFALRPDSMLLRWEQTYELSSNPVKRWKEYVELKKRSEHIDQILNKMKSWFSSNLAVYGFDIQIGIVKDSLLLSTFAQMKRRPTIPEIYAMLDRLAVYAKTKGAQVTGYPMLNITRTDSTDHLVRVALIIDRMIPESGDITIKRMVPTADAVTLEVKGGEASIANAIRQAENFISDRRFATPAISFQQMKTNRLVEKDTAGWVTRLVYPIL